MRVLLISMPFASIKTPSLALSQLKSVLIKSNISCDIKYLNIEFRKYCFKTEYFDDIASFWNIGEWVFKHILNQDNKEISNEDIKYLNQTINLDEAKTNKIINQLVHLRSKAAGFIDSCMVSIDFEKYDMIGFSSVFAQNIASLSLAKEIKHKFPSKIIAFGGANCFGSTGKLLIKKFNFIDWVFTGESEISLPKMLHAYKKKTSNKDIHGVYFRTNKEDIKGDFTNMLPDLNSLPLPNYSDYLNQIKKLFPMAEDEVQLTFEMSRGCWWADKSKCIFCGLNSENVSYREKRSKIILREIENLDKISKSRMIRAVDNNIPRSSYSNVFPKVNRYKFKEIFVETMASISKENLRVLKVAGVNRFQPGIESLNNIILKHIRKGTSALHNIQLLKWAREYNMEIEWNFIYNFPEEETKGYSEMTKTIPLITHFRPTERIGPVILQRYSPMFNDCYNYKIENIKPNIGYKSFYNLDETAIFNLVYTFSYTHDFPKEHAPAVSSVCTLLQEWSNLWSENKEPPFLAYEKLNNGQLKVFDTRPCKIQTEKTLKKLESKIILLSDSITTVEKLAEQITDNNEEDIKKAIKQLEMDKFLIRDKSQLLSLICDIDLLNVNGGSMLAKMLV